MLSSTLLPKIHRNRPLPSRCSHPPCRNIEVSGVRMLFASSSTTQAIPAPIGTAVPRRARWVSSPGTIPQLQTLAASARASSPAP